MIILDLFEYIIKVIIHLIVITITKEEYTKGQGEKGQPGYRKEPFPQHLL